MVVIQIADSPQPGQGPLFVLRPAFTDCDEIPPNVRMAPRSRAQADQADHFLPDGLTLDQYEQDLIREALRRADGNKSQAARLLGLTRNALRYRLTQMGLES